MLYLLILALCTFLCEAELILDIENGVLRGKYMKSRKGRQFRAFLGIPYAKAPVDDLRFEPPQNPENWKGIRDATKSGEVCFQTDGTGRKVLGSEDCLTLNVYAPKDAANLPVMMHIHTGAYFFGGGSPYYYSPEVLLDRDVVLVVIQYRLGALGFLATGDEVVPGNNGIKDQVMALKWIQKNIRHFGGDPDSVTVFGNSAGGGSVYLLSLSPLAKGLFHAAIIQSGFEMCDWSLQTNQQSRQLSKKLGAIMGCPTYNSSTMVECMRKLPISDFSKARSELLQWYDEPTDIFKPALEVDGPGALISETPGTLLRRGYDLPVLIGTVKNEGSVKAAPIYENPARLQELDADFDNLAYISLLFTNKRFKKIMPEVRQFYFGPKHLSEYTKQSLIDMYTDGLFLHCTDSVIELLRKYSSKPLYQYLLSYQGRYSYANFLGTKDRSYGVTHLDELQYLFKVTAYGLGKPFDKSDGRMADAITKCWTNFAKYKEPGHCYNDGVEWQPIKSDEHEYLNIYGPRHMVMEKNLAWKRLNFWRKLRLNEL